MDRTRLDQPVVETDASYVARRVRPPEFPPASPAEGDAPAHAEFRFRNLHCRVGLPGRYSLVLVEMAKFGLGLGSLVGCLAVILSLAPGALAGAAVAALCALAAVLTAALTYAAVFRRRR